MSEKPRIRYDVRFSTDGDMNDAAVVAHRFSLLLDLLCREGRIETAFGDTQLSVVKVAVMDRAERKHDECIAKHRAARTAGEQ